MFPIYDDSDNYGCSVSRNYASFLCYLRLLYNIVNFPSFEIVSYLRNVQEEEEQEEQEGEEDFFFARLIRCPSAPAPSSCIQFLFY